MAGASEPVAWVALQLYHNPVSDSYKVTEIRLLDAFAAVRGDLRRLSIASMWHETVELSYAAGSGEGALYRLLLDALRRLNTCGSPRNGRDEVMHVNIQFLWRFLGLLGVRPDVTLCTACRRRLDEREPLHYVVGRSGFLCERCVHRSATRSLVLGPGARRYLRRTVSLPLERAITVTMEPPTAVSVEQILRRFLQEVVDRPLRTVSFAMEAP